MLDIPFAFSSNGDGFAEHGFLTGTEREFDLDEFPTEEELIARYKAESALTPAQETIIDQPYYSSQTTYSPRYYQRIAINRTLDAIAKGQDRLLLVMATGTGKTYTAFQIVYRLLQSVLEKAVFSGSQNQPYGDRYGGFPGSQWNMPECFPAAPYRRSLRRPDGGYPCRSFCTSGRSRGWC